MKTDKKIGLALGSGGGRGMAHIGVIKSLNKHNIPIDYIAGSSIGAIIGGLYAATGDIKEVEKIANSLNFKKFIKSFFKGVVSRKTILDKNFDIFFKNIIGDVKIEDLKIPFCAVGSNLFTGELELIKNGDLITAIKASTAIPLLLRPVKIDDKYIFDGGVISPVPTKVVRQMGADVVLGVSLYGNIFPINLTKDRRLSKLKAGMLSRFLALKRLTEMDLSEADITLSLKIPNEDYGVFKKFLSNQKLIEFGFESTEEIIDEIKKVTR